MRKLLPLQDDSKPENEEWMFHCPGCDAPHAIRSKGEKPSWSFAGGPENPTFNPSYLLKYNDINGKKVVCHSYINNGRIRFLTDCTHHLAGKTVDLPSMEDY